MRTATWLTSLLFFPFILQAMVLPDGFEPIATENSHPELLARFRKKGLGGFLPSISVVCEACPLSLEQYIQLTKERLEKNNSLSVEETGPFQTLCVKGHLRTISKKTPYGTAILKQLIVPKKPYFYIVTSSILEKESPSLSYELEKSFASFDFEQFPPPIFEGPSTSIHFDPNRLHKLN